MNAYRKVYVIQFEFAYTGGAAYWVESCGVSVCECVRMRECVGVFDCVRTFSLIQISISGMERRRR